MLRVPSFMFIYTIKKQLWLILKLNCDRVYSCCFKGSVSETGISLPCSCNSVDSVRNLGVFDADFSCSEVVLISCKACFLQMHDLCHIRQYLTGEGTILVANALVVRTIIIGQVYLDSTYCIQNTRIVTVNLLM